MKTEVKHKKGCPANTPGWYCDCGRAKVKVMTYGKTETFKTEGDMYEHITGRRSKVLDAANTIST